MTWLELIHQMMEASNERFALSSRKPKREGLPLVVDRREIKYIVIHTAADPRGVDTTVEDINRWHLARGWSGIGYNWVVRKSGEVQQGRDKDRTPAHVKYFNHHSLGICLSGHGDLEPPTEKQWSAAVKLVADLIEERRHTPLLDAFMENPNRVLGHREVGLHRLVPKPIRKSCPGKLINMRDFRLDVKAKLTARGF